MTKQRTGERYGAHCAEPRKRRNHRIPIRPAPLHPPIPTPLIIDPRGLHVTRPGRRQAQKSQACFALAFAGASALLYSGLPSASGLSPRPTRKATWRSGYATVCKTVYTSSILVVASIRKTLNFQIKLIWSDLA